jgi:hypothetical protein
LIFCFKCGIIVLKILEKEILKMINRNVPFPDISPDFTIDDIHKIREWSYERRKDATIEEFNQDMEECSAGFRRQLQKIREEREKREKLTNPPEEEI